MTFTMADSSNKKSMDKSLKVGSYSKEEKSKISSGTSDGSMRGVSDRTGNAIIFVDIVQADLDHIARSNSSAADAKSKQKQYVENVVEHEGTHNMGSPDTNGDGALTDPGTVDPDHPDAAPQIEGRGAKHIKEHLEDTYGQ